MAPTLEVHRALLDRARIEMERDRIPGLGIGVYHQGRLATAGLGITNIVNPQAVDGETMFQIASVTKTFTATAILQLVDQGQLHLDDPVRAHLPDFAVADAEVSNAVTIRDCLTHSCGWEGDVFDDTGSGDDALAISVSRMRTLTQDTPLGQLWSYNNAAFYVLGRIIEVAHRRSFEDVLKTTFLAPTGMDDASFFAHEVIHRKIAIGHARHGGRTVIARPWVMPRCVGPVGGLIASPTDLMMYAKFQFEGGHVLSDELRQSAFEPAGPSGDRPEIGLGWWLDDRSGERVVSHGGGANGAPCQFAMVPSRNFALAVLTNGEDGNRTADRILQWALGEYFGLMPKVRSVRSDENTNDWAGVYESRLERRELRYEQDRLVLDQVGREWLRNMYPPPSSSRGSAVEPLGDGDMRIATGTPSETTGTILRDGTGEARWLRISRRAALRE